MYYSDEIINEVRERNDIYDVISGYVSLKRHGSSYLGLCPFHNDRSPSFSVSPQKQIYKCFSCDKGGNVFTFIQEYENCSFPEAVKILADKVGVTLPDVEDNEEIRKSKSKKVKIYEINKVAATYYYHQLRSKQGELGMRYFEGRKLSPEIMKAFGLGYALQYSDGLVKYLRSQGFEDELIRESGLVNFDEKYGLSDKFINRVMFPICDAGNKVIAFGGRVLGDAKPKYLNSPETLIFDKSQNLYGLNIAKSARKNQLILCEGYMDVIAMHQAGFNQAVASLGTAFTSKHANVVKRHTTNVLLAYDSDGPGVKAAIRASGILREVGITAKVINMRPYKDPDEFIKNLGVEEFQNRIDNAENNFMFEIRMLKESTDLSDPGAETNFQTQIAERLLRFEEELERNNYLQAVAREYMIDANGLKKKVSEVAKTYFKEREREEIRQQVREETQKKKADKEDGTKRNQRLLLTWLVEEPNLYSKIREYITAKDFTDELYNQLAVKLFEDIDNNTVNPARMIDMFEDIEDQRKVAEVFETKLPAIETREERQTAFKDIVVAVKQNSFAHFSSLMGADVNALQEVITGKQVLEELIRKPITID